MQMYKIVIDLMLSQLIAQQSYQHLSQAISIKRRLILYHLGPAHLLPQLIAQQPHQHLPKAVSCCQSISPWGEGHRGYGTQGVRARGQQR